MPDRDNLHADLAAFAAERGLTTDDLLNAVRPMARGTATANAAVPDMGGYPLLVYGPKADPKARIARTGTPVEDVIADPDGSGATPEELAEARRWAGSGT